MDSCQQVYSAGGSVLNAMLQICHGHVNIESFKHRY
ncbi:MAG: hypothetical protein ACJATW_002856 [Glaciecola sp.]|jgi:hypothetical protein